MRELKTPWIALQELTEFQEDKVFWFPVFPEYYYVILNSSSGRIHVPKRFPLINEGIRVSPITIFFVSRAKADGRLKL
jgi:hypothetical protein